MDGKPRNRLAPLPGGGAGPTREALQVGFWVVQKLPHPGGGERLCDADPENVVEVEALPDMEKVEPLREKLPFVICKLVVKVMVASPVQNSHETGKPICSPASIDAPSEETTKVMVLPCDVVPEYWPGVTVSVARITTVSGVPLTFPSFTASSIMKSPSASAVNVGFTVVAVDSVAPLPAGRETKDHE